MYVKLRSFRPMMTTSGASPWARSHSARASSTACSAMSAGDVCRLISPTYLRTWARGLGAPPSAARGHPLCYDLGHIRGQARAPHRQLAVFSP